MKKLAMVAGICICFAAGLVYLIDDADAEQVVTARQVSGASNTDLPIFTPEPETYKKCGFDSDCPHGKCKSGKCGACGFDSDCKGWGKCKQGRCGACGFDSDCKGFGKCKSGRCTKSPY